MKKSSGSIFKKIAKIFGLTLLLAVFIGTLVFLYQKSQPKPDVFEIQKAQVTNIKENCGHRFGSSPQGDRN